jgi:MraZ protein
LILEPDDQATMVEGSLDFHGSFYHTVDTKGRVSLPVKFRTMIGQRIVVTLGFDPCVWILPESSWKAWLKKVRSMSQLDPAVRKLTRHMVGNAQECEIDRLGRIHLSAPIRSYAGIEKDVVVMGMIDAIEIWDKDRFEKRQVTDLEALNSNAFPK